MLRLASASLLLALAAALRAQDATAAPQHAAAAAPAPQPAVADDSAQKAAQALDLAARFQRGATPRAAPASLHGRFHVSARDDKGNLVKAEVERWYRRAPEAMLTTRKELVSGLSTSVVSNGGVVWLRDDGDGSIHVYSDNPAVYEVDLELQREHLRLTRMLLDACVLDALRSRLVSPHVTGHDRVEDPDGGEHQIVLVEAMAPDELFGPAPGAPPLPPGSALPPIELRLGIDEQDGALRSLRVRAPHRPDLSPMLLVFAFHGRTESGLNVPANIKLFREGEPVEALSLAIEEDEAGHLLFDVDVPVDDALFARPAPAAK